VRVKSLRSRRLLLVHRLVQDAQQPVGEHDRCKVREHRVGRRLRQCIQTRESPTQGPSLQIAPTEQQHRCARQGSAPIITSSCMCLPPSTQKIRQQAYQTASFADVTRPAALTDMAKTWTRFYTGLADNCLLSLDRSPSTRQETPARSVWSRASPFWTHLFPTFHLWSTLFKPTCTEKTSRAAGVVYDVDGLLTYGFVVDVVSVLARRVPTAACSRRRRVFSTPCASMCWLVECCFQPQACLLVSANEALPKLFQYIMV